MVAMLCMSLLSFADELTVNNGTSTNTYVPIYGLYTDTRGTHSQYIQPAADLAALVGAEINGLKFYLNESSLAWGAPVFSVKLKEVSQTSLSSAFVSMTDATEVYNGTLTVASNELNITFATPYVYDGGNLVVEIAVVTAGGYKTSTFKGVSATGAARYASSATASGTAANFLPKTTISYEPAATSCAKPGAIVKDTVADDFANIHWAKGGSETSWEVVLTGNDNTVTTVVTDTFTSLTGLRAYTDYSVKVCAICAVGDSSRYVSTTFKTAKACKDMGTLSVVAVSTYDSLKFRWKSVADVEGYEYVLVLKDSAINESLAVATTDTVVAFNGLLSNTAYDLYVRTSCGGTKRGEWKRVSARTACGPVVTLPYTEGFESYSVGSYSAENTYCWLFLGNVHTSSSDYPQVYVNNSSGYYHSGTKSLYFKSKANTAEYAIMPEINVDFSGKEIIFWYRNEGTSTSNGLMSFGYMTDPTSASSFVSLFDQTDRTTTFVKASVDLSTVPAGARLAFRYTGGSSDNYYFAIDDIEIREMPSCRPAKTISVSAIDFTTATFGWAVSNGESEWQLQYKPTSSTAYTTVNLDANSFQLTGLTAGTAYSYNLILHSVCEGVLSPDSTTATLKFTTECEELEPVNDTIVFALTETTLTPCYTTFVSTGTSTDKWSVSTSQKHGANNSYYLSYSAKNHVLALPKVDLPAGYELTFWTKESSTHYAADSLRVWINNSPSLEGATLLGKVEFPATVAWNQYRMNIPVSGHDMYVMFEGFTGSSGYVYVGDVVLQPAPNCLPATNLQMGAVQTDQVIFSWEAGADEASWHVVVEGGIDSIAEGSFYDEFDLDTTVLVYTGLDPQTVYELKVTVQSDCGDGNLATELLTETYKFVTPCIPLDLTTALPGDTAYFLGFESDDAYEQFELGEITQEAHPCLMSGSYWSDMAFNVVNNNAHSGSNSLKLDAYTDYSDDDYDDWYDAPARRVASKGPRRVAYYPSSGSPAWLRLPYMNLPEANSMEISFWAKKGQTYSSTVDSIAVYVSPDADFEHDVQIIRTGNLTGTYQKFSAVIPNAGLQYILILGYTEDGSSSYYYSYSAYPLYLDDIAITRRSDCRPVTNLKVDSISTNAVKFAWTPGYQETEWKVVVKQGNDTLFNNTTTNPYFVIDTLQPAHRYTYKVTVKAMCGGVEAEEFLPEQTLTFGTDCNAVSTFPIFYGFERAEGFTTATNATTNTLPLCWNTEELSFSGSTGAGRLWAASSSYKHSGSWSMCLPDKGSSSAVSKTLLSFPVMQMDAAKAYEVVFWVYRNGTTSGTANPEGFRIFASHNSTMDETAVELGFVSRHPVVGSALAPAESTTGWYKYSVDVPMTGEVHLFFQGESWYGAATYVDDVTIREKPLCDGATSLHVVADQATSSSVTLAWSGNAAEYIVSYASSDSAIVGNTVVSDTAIVISGLAAGKAYVFNAYVVAKCSATEQAADTLFGKNISVVTECEAIAALPWNEDFEAQPTASYPIPACWSAIKLSGSSTNTNNVYVNNTTYAKGAKSLFFTMAANSSSYIYAVLPEITADLSNAEIMFSYKMESATSSGYLDFGYVTDATDGSTFVSMKSCARLASWADSTVALASVPSGARLAFRYGNAGGSYSTQYYLGIDDIKIREIPTCFPGSNLHAIDSLATTSSVSFGWTPQSADNLNAHIIVKNGNTVVADATVNDSVYTVTGLSSSKAYTLSVQVFTVCDAIESADAVSGTFSVATLCDAINVFPWNEGFESFAVGTTVSPAPLCWSSLNTNEGSYPYMYVSNASTYVKTGTKCLYFVSSNVEYAYAIFPEFSDLSDKQIRFSYKDENANSSGYLYLGYMTNASDESTFVQLAEYARTTTMTDTDPFVLSDVPAGARLAFKYGGASSNFYLGIDDIVIETAPACHKPTAVVATPSTTGVVLTWLGNSAAYDVVVKAANDTVAATQVSAESLSISNLTPGTKYTYNVKIQGICGSDSSAVLSTTVTFITECLPVASLPWAEGFETSDASAMAICWTGISNSSYPYVYASSANTGSKTLYTYAGSSYYGDTYIVLPEFASDIRTAILKFYYKQSYASGSYAPVEVGVMASATDTASFQLISTLEKKTSYTLQEIDLGSAPTGYDFVALRVLKDAGNATAYYFDDFEMVLAPTCRKPGDITLASATESDATFAWTASGDETQWLVKRTVANVVEDSILVSAPNYTWSGLLANTKYTCTLSVQAYCDAENQSDARVATFTFRTALSADAKELMNQDNKNFTADFSSAAEQSKWISVDGNGVNNFVFGTAATACLDSATSALYVSNDGTAHNYATGTTSGALIYRQFNFPAVDSLKIEFDWVANGEVISGSYYDYGRALLAPASLELSVNGSSLYVGSTSTAIGGSAVPAGAVDLAGGAMGGVSTAQHVSVELQDVAAGDYNLIFGWRNDSSSGTQYPLAIANLNVTILDVQGPETDIENLYGESGEKAVKFIHNGHVYISFHGVVYDATGRMVENVK